TKTGTANGSMGTTTPVSGSVYDVTVNSVIGNGTLRLDLNSSGTGIQDAATNPISGGFTSGQTYTIDNTAPTVSSINRQTPAAQTTNATSVTFRVTFSENVTGVDSTDFSLTHTGGAGGTIGTTTPVSGSVYDVAVGSVTGDGTLGMNLPSSGTGITDTAGNP